MKTGLRVVRLGVIALVLLVCSGLNASAQETIKLGFVADMSGIGAAYYKSQKAAMDLFIEETNAAGGILGRKLELIVRDAQLKPDIGANVARELVLNEKCDFLIGGTSSGVALAVTKVAHELKKIVYFHTSNTEVLTTTEFQPYMFQVVPNTGEEGRGCALYLSEKPIKKVGFVGYDYSYGHEQWKAFKGEMEKRKPDVEFVDTIWVKTGETNYSSYIPTLMSKSPDAIFGSLWGAGLSSFIKQGAPYGLFKKSTLTSLYDLDLLRAVGKDMPEGQLGYGRCPFYAVDTPEMKAFTRKYYEKTKEWPADWAITSYDGLIVLAEAMKKANTVDSEQLIKVIEGMKFPSLRGERYIRAEDHMANVGIYVGTTAKDPNYPDFLILKDVVEVPAEKIWLSVEEVVKTREKK